MASAEIATSQAKRCYGDLTVLRRSNMFTETTTRIQRSKLEKIRGNAEDPGRPPDLVGFGAVPFETEPHRVTEYAKTARPYSISCRADLLPVCRKFRYRGEDTPLMLQNIRERHGSCPGYNNSKQSTPEE